MTTFDKLKKQRDAEYRAFIEAGGNPIDFFTDGPKTGVPSAQLGSDSDDGDHPEHGDDACSVSIDKMFDEIARRAAKE